MSYRPVAVVCLPEVALVTGSSSSSGLAASRLSEVTRASASRWSSTRSSNRPSCHDPMKMQKGMASSTKTLIPHQRGVSRNRYTPSTVRVRGRFPSRGVRPRRAGTSRDEPGGRARTSRADGAGTDGAVDGAVDGPVEDHVEVVHRLGTSAARCPPGRAVWGHD